MLSLAEDVVWMYNLLMYSPGKAVFFFLMLVQKCHHSATLGMWGLPLPLLLFCVQLFIKCIFVSQNAVYELNFQAAFIEDIVSNLIFYLGSSMQTKFSIQGGSVYAIMIFYQKFSRHGRVFTVWYTPEVTTSLSTCKISNF